MARTYLENLQIWKSEYLINKRLENIPFNLPEDLELLQCAGNCVSEIPDYLPKTLLDINFSRNNITKIDNLPNGLIYLNLCANSITEIPKKLPNTLKTIHLERNLIEKIPSDLPQQLRILHLRDNLIETVSDLPENITSLGLQKNPIKKLSDLTLPGLVNLWIDRGVEFENCFFGMNCHLIGYGFWDYTQKLSIDAMSYRYGKKDPKDLNWKVDLIKGHFELWSLREEGARFKRARREYEELFG